MLLLIPLSMIGDIGYYSREKPEAAFGVDCMLFSIKGGLLMLGFFEAASSADGT